MEEAKKELNILKKLQEFVSLEEYELSLTNQGMKNLKKSKN